MEIDKELFIQICNESQSMAEASRKLCMHFNTFSRYAKKFGCYKPNRGHKGIKVGHYKNHISTEDILKGLYPDYQTYKLKKRLIDEGYIEDKCMRCGWSEKPKGSKYTTCELHHKDGNPHNHKEENLELICPNCHSLTDNYRSKNRAHE